jgi:hypothetical protein
MASSSVTSAAPALAVDAPHPRAGNAAASRAAWIISPAVDLTIFVFVTLLTIGPWIASDKLGVPGQWVLIGVALFNGPHLISTWTRVYLPRKERFRRPLHYWVMPGLLATFAISCIAAGGLGPVYLRTVIFYWASWHFVAQAYGILRIYQRKHGAIGSTAAKLEKALLFGVCFFCVLRRVYTGPWDLFGVQIIHPYPRAWEVNAVGGVVLAIAIAYVIHLLRRPQPFVRPLLIACTAFGFAMPFLVIKNGTSAFAAAALWHAVQYIGIVWQYNRTRYAGRHDPDARLISWVSQPGRSIAYIAVMAACAAAVYSLAFATSRATGWEMNEIALALWTALTLGHYYLDGVIWKFKQYDLQNLV